MKNKEYPVPKFNNLEEEDVFWKTHSPLMEGFEGKVQKKKQNRTSFLSVRLTGEELTRFREQAISYGLSTSTFARLVLLQSMESGKSFLPADLIFSLCNNTLPNTLTDQEKETYYHQLNKIFNEYRRIQDEMVKMMITICPPNGLETRDNVEQSDKIKVKD